MGSVRSGVRAPAWFCLLLAGSTLAVPAAAEPATAAREPVLAAAAERPGRLELAPALEAAWLDRSQPLAERAARTRSAALQLGLSGLDPAARALLTGPGGPRLARARQAVRLAPDLPAAQAALAWALLSEAHEPLEALKVASGSLRALDRNLETSLWTRATLLHATSRALTLGSLLFLLVAALAWAPRVVHDLGHLRRAPSAPFARAALMAAVVLAPVSLGEGLAGLALGLLALVAVRARGAELGTALLAAAALAAGLHPLTNAAGSYLGAFAADPVAEAFHATEAGLASAQDVQRLRRAAPRDPLAARALALHARRAGRLADADARYRGLLHAAPDDPLLANDAANVRLALGRTQEAISLYETALESVRSPLVYFNLAQAYGQAIRLDDQSRALAAAQELDPVAVAEMSTLGELTPQTLVFDLGVPVGRLRERMLERGRHFGVAGALRAPLAPGWLGRSAGGAAAALLLVLTLAWAVSSRIVPSRACRRCARSLCSRCTASLPPGELCAGCARCPAVLALPIPSGGVSGSGGMGSGGQRLRRARAVRLAPAIAVLVPGAAGILARRPLLGLVGASGFVGALALLLPSAVPAPDPLAAGMAGRWLVALVAAGCLAVHLGILVTTRRRWGAP